VLSCGNPSGWLGWLTMSDGDTDKPSLVELIDNIRSGDPDVRVNAAEAMGDMGPSAAQAIPVLVALLKNSEEDDIVRGYAAWVLCRIGSEAVPVLVELLKEPDEPWVPGPFLADLTEFSARAKMAVQEERERAVCFVRRQAAWALGEVGAVAEPALPALERMLKDANRYASGAAAEAVHKIKERGRAGEPR